MQVNQKKNKPQNVKRIIAVASAKGGVGKSTFAANYAVALADMGYKVALVDADIHGPSVNHLMNIDKKSEVINNKIIPILSHNVKCVSIASIIDEQSAAVFRGPMITKILYQLIMVTDFGYKIEGKKSIFNLFSSKEKFSKNHLKEKNIKSDMLNEDVAKKVVKEDATEEVDAKEVVEDIDFMIIDMPPGTGDVYLSIAEKFAIDGVIVISTPQTLSIIDVIRSIDCFKKLNIKILGLVENMSYLRSGDEKLFIFGEGELQKMAKKYEIDIIGKFEIFKDLHSITQPYYYKNKEYSEEIKNIILRVNKKL